MSFSIINCAFRGVKCHYYNVNLSLTFDSKTFKLNWVLYICSRYKYGIHFTHPFKDFGKNDIFVELVK